jgi:hypothetical protein
MVGMKLMKINRSGKFAATFLAGAIIAGGIGAVASTPTTSSISACADKRTGALFLSATGSCPTNRTLIQIGGSAMDAKAIASLVTPTVVSISVSSSTGSGTGSGSIYKSSASGSYIVTNNHVIEDAATGGTIKVEFTNGDQVITLNENQSTYIPQGQTHRLANPGKTPLEIIEVQSGSYLGEDDIVRYEDVYARR